MQRIWYSAGQPRVFEQAVEVNRIGACAPAVSKANAVSRSQLVPGARRMRTRGDITSEVASATPPSLHAMSRSTSQSAGGFVAGMRSGGDLQPLVVGHFADVGQRHIMLAEDRFEWPRAWPVRLPRRTGWRTRRRAAPCRARRDFGSAELSCGDIRQPNSCPQAAGEGHFGERPRPGPLRSDRGRRGRGLG